MDIIGLIAQTPGLGDRLNASGLDDASITRLADALTMQLRNEGEDDLTDLLTILTAQTFIDVIDWRGLVADAGVGDALAESFVLALGPVVQSFAGSSRRLDADVVCPRHRWFRWPTAYLAPAALPPRAAAGAGL